MLEPGDGAVGTQRALAATVAVATSTLMWESGELSEEQYASAVLLCGGIFEGAMPLQEGLRTLMGLWMAGPVAVAVNGYGPGTHPH